jgi:crossover junction endodeoxyribonuclease RusA
MTRAPKNPATGSPPVSRRAALVTPGGPGPVARVTGPGGKTPPPAVAPSLPGPEEAPSSPRRGTGGSGDAVPGTGGADPAAACRLPASPGRGLSRTPAGGALVADSAPSAGSRTYTIALPAGLPLLSQNGRFHHFERNRRVQVLKKAAWLMALKEKIPPLERASIVVEYQPRDSRDTDPDNVPPASGKPCIDGLVAAGVLPDDNARYVTDVSGKIGPKFPRGRLVLHITEVAAATGGEAA